ncbi:MAG: hypothetical protein M1840_006734 [Geoglossum simile]|nr:MAG: hypothetical protein M1840_006734 [Geoglossum simile]
MVGDIFDLLGLDPNRDQDVEQLKKAYRRAMLVTHPDKTANNPKKTGDNAKAVQLNELKEFLCDFDPGSPRIWRRVAELFRRGKDGRASSSRGHGHVPRPTPAGTLAKPGSSPSNPIVIAPGIGAPASLPVGPPNRNGKPRARTELRRQRRSRRSSYYPSQASIRGKDGSSPLNPIIIDAPGIGAPASLAVDPLNRKGIRAKLCQRRRNRRSSYYPSRASEWRPAPYADQSDSDLGWN